MTSSSAPRGDTSKRLPLPQRTATSRLIVVIRAGDAAQYPALLEALGQAGVRSVELTLTTPGTLEAVPHLVEQFAGLLDLGVGTVTAPVQVQVAAQGGAAYVVTPVMTETVIAAARAEGLPVIPGGLTPTELHAGWSAGASALKVFPASVVGPGYVKDLRGPFPELQVIPSGGVDQEAARAWLAAGAAAVSVGGPLLGDAVMGGSLSALTERAREFVDLCEKEAGV